MKKTIGFSFLLISSLAFAKKPVPLTFEVNSLINSNIDRVANPVKKDIYSQKILLKTKLKYRPIKKVILIDLPSFDLEYTPSLTEKVRNLSISNTLLALYLPKRGLIYTGALNANYTKSIFTNEDQEIEDSKNWSIGLDGGVSKDLNKKYNLGVNLGIKVQTYLEPSNPNDALPLKDNNLKLSGKLSQKVKIMKGHKAGVHLAATNKIYKEKRALNSSGDQISTSPETILTYKFIANYSIKMKYWSLSPELGYALNKDTIEDGRTYRGAEYKVKFNYYFAKFNFNSNISYKVRDYKTQLVDTVDTTGVSPLLEARIVGIGNSIEIPFGKAKNYLFLVGFDYQGLKSNRISDDNSNNIFKVGLRAIF